MILAIGNAGAYEVEAYQLVVRELEKQGEKALLFKQDKCLENDFFTFKLEKGKPQYFVIINDEEYDLDLFSAIWYMHPHLPRELLMYEPAEHRAILDRQFLEMRRALWTLYRQNKKWINDPWKMMMVENKICQSFLAIESGFTLPDTIITSDPDVVRRFYDSHDGNIIVKGFASAPTVDQAIFTSKLKLEDMEKIDSLRLSPAIFQANVPKAYELRITVAGRKIYPIKIFSQEDEETAIDWRRNPKLNDFDVKMEPTTIPKNVEDFIFTFMQKANLRFGCFDMIVTPEGKYIFLEINPNGQWYFVQLRTGIQIAEAIAGLLL